MTRSTIGIAMALMATVGFLIGLIAGLLVATL